METITYKPLIVTAFILTIATVANAQVTKQEQSALTPDKVLTDLMAGNARFAALVTRSTTLIGHSGHWPKVR